MHCAQSVASSMYLFYIIKGILGNKINFFSFRALRWLVSKSKWNSWYLASIYLHSTVFRRFLNQKINTLETIHFQLQFQNRDEKITSKLNSAFISTAASDFCIYKPGAEKLCIDIRNSYVLYGNRLNVC